MKLQENFTYEEFWAKSGVAARQGIDNTPTKEAKEYIEKLAEVLQIVRNAYGKPIIVDSGYRCPKLNKAVGGVTNSDHLYGAAADIHSKSDKPVDNKELFDVIVKLAKEGKIKCRQILDEYGYNWIHISINNKYNKQKDNQILHIK